MTSKLTILSIDPEAAGEDVRRMQEALCLLEQLRQLLKNIGSRDLADLAAHATGELQEAVRCIRESARKYENVELELELTRPGEGSGAVWLAAAAAKLLAQVPTHEEWACREQAAIDRAHCRRQAPGARADGAAERPSPFAAQSLIPQAIPLPSYPRPLPAFFRRPRAGSLFAAAGAESS